MQETGFTGIGLFADQRVGEQTLEFLATHHPEDLRFLVATGRDSPVYQAATKRGFPKDRIFVEDDLYHPATIDRLRRYGVSYFILAWWPSILKEPLLSLPKIGVVNFHPSLLPSNRGKHYNFWTIVEDTPFGVTLHFAEESVDGGDIIFQKPIAKSWEDTGKTLYEKAQKAIVELFRETYPDIVRGNYMRRKQDTTR
ncbi:MAG: hypothetical protein LUQ33_02845, partial [Methanoregulaceae archaeon]|nr:hypothetical protein [Methanoregulaceae archaeon]